MTNATVYYLMSYLSDKYAIIIFKNLLKNN